MSGKATIIAGAIFLIIFLAGSYVFLARGSNKPSIQPSSYSVNDKERPKISIDKKMIDLGKIKVSDQKETEFTIKNIGTKPLQLSNMSTSCHCTHGLFIYKGQTSEEYGMSNPSDILPEIAPQTEATIRAIYRPYEMPVYGPVERELYISTNDPTMPKLVLQVTATVQ